MNIRDLQEYVNEYSKLKGFDKNTIQTRTLYLVTEIGELAKDILKISFDPNEELYKKTKEDIGLEMFDVVWNIIDLANKLDIDLINAFEQKMEINKNRHWK